jgi:3-carboxy-cis,cis-muconate cycloisomerase
MKQNLNLDGGLLMAESVMMGLAPKIGRGQAHEIVAAAANRAIDNKCTLREALLEDAKIMQLVTVEEIDRLLDPGNYLGSAQAMIDAVLERAG